MPKRKKAKRPKRRHATIIDDPVKGPPPPSVREQSRQFLQENWPAAMRWPPPEHLVKDETPKVMRLFGRPAFIIDGMALNLVVSESGHLDLVRNRVDLRPTNQVLTLEMVQSAINSLKRNGTQPTVCSCGAEYSCIIMGSKLKIDDDVACTEGACLACGEPLPIAQVPPGNRILAVPFALADPQDSAEAPR